MTDGDGSAGMRTEPDDRGQNGDAGNGLARDGATRRDGTAGRDELPPAVPNEPVSFPGLDKVLEVLQELTRRPRFNEAPPPSPPGKRAGIPMMCLVRSKEHRGALSKLAGFLRTARPKRIPHALHTFRWAEPSPKPEESDHLADPTAEDVDAVATVLVSVAQQLSMDQNGRYGKFRFRRFHLVYWLMKQTFTGEDGRMGQPLPELLMSALRRRDLRRNDDTLLNGAARGELPQLPLWAQLLVRFVPSLWFRVRLSKAVPFVGTEYRWLLNQPYLAAGDPGSFLGFAERIASALADVKDGRRAAAQGTSEAPDQLLMLLVNAFLEDIRRAYRRRIWRPRTARRTVYPVVLVDNISRQNGGYLLFKAINDVRNDTGAFDPVLFVSGSFRVPPRAREREEKDVEEKTLSSYRADAAYKAWKANLEVSSRRREPTAWYMAIKVPDSAGEDSWDHVRLEMPRAPLWSRRSVLAAVVLLLVTGAVWFGGAQINAHCGYTILNENFATLELLEDGQCVGVSSERIQLTGHARAGQNDADDLQRFDAAQNAILERNDAVAEIRARAPERPYMTLVYLSAFSTDRYTLASEQERLMGVAARQLEALDSGQGPLVRILFANGGDEMQAGERVAGMIRELAEDDSSIVGVIGLALSREETVTAVRAVGDAGLPMIAATLSADEMPDASDLYFQVSPQNSRQVDIVARHMRRTGPQVNRVRVVYSNESADIYSGNLKEVATKVFTDYGYTVTAHPFAASRSRGVDAQTMGEELCGTPADEVIFFAGRPADFGSMMPAVGRCPQSDRPRIIANDDVARYVADSDLLSRINVPFEYVSFGLGAPDCSGDHGLYRNMLKIFEDACAPGRNPSLDGHAALAYDAMSTFIDAAPPNRTPTAVQLVSEFYDTEFSGASGIIDFKNSTTRGIPADKFIAVMSVDTALPNGGVRVSGYCGRPPAEEDPGLRAAAVDLCGG